MKEVEQIPVSGKASRKGGVESTSSFHALKLAAVTRTWTKRLNIISNYVKLKENLMYSKWSKWLYKIVSFLVTGLSF